MRRDATLQESVSKHHYIDNILHIPHIFTTLVGGAHLLSDSSMTIINCHCPFYHTQPF